MLLNPCQRRGFSRLRYRAQAPIVDGLMKELGFDGSTLENLVAGAAPKPAEVPTVTVMAGERDLDSLSPAGRGLG
jgi:hypothetical protein